MNRGEHRGAVARAGVIVAIIGAAAIGPAPGAAAREQDGFETVVAALNWNDKNDRADQFRGRLGSKESQCLHRRRVTLLRVAPGRDRKVASGRTDNAGSFAFAREDPGSGRYYLRVKERRIGLGTCERGQSKQLRVSDVAEI